MVAYFDDLAAALAREQVDAAELAHIASAHGMEVVAPPSGQYV
jgi:hypothetical protein